MNCIINAWQKHEAELRIYLIKQLKNKYNAEDLLQETFVKAITQGSSFCQLENPRAWLFRVTKNQLIDHFRRNKTHFKSDDLGESLAEIQTEIAAVETLSSCLPRVLKQLNHNDQEIIRLCDLEGMSQQTYALKKGISLMATKSRIQRSRKKLKQHLKEMCQIRFDDNGNVCCFVPKVD